LIEKHYTPAEIADRIGVSDDTVRRMFEQEPGVLVIGAKGNAKGRRYRTIRIPESVADRVLNRMVNPVSSSSKCFSLKPTVSCGSVAP